MIRYDELRPELMAKEVTKGRQQFSNVSFKKASGAPQNEKCLTSKVIYILSYSLLLHPSERDAFSCWQFPSVCATCDWPHFLLAILRWDFPQNVLPPLSHEVGSMRQKKVVWRKFQTQNAACGRHSGAGLKPLGNLKYFGRVGAESGADADHKSAIWRNLDVIRNVTGSHQRVLSRRGMCLYLKSE